ncbi:glycyl-radical enzyme activating protein [Qingrenia yutianensis]|uniref:Glycyl-radical enzyme activating protein n=1 Tax=Qingrenia yutianensis TaxID=2763676 RepID=A0A926F994_9FIRM|nr:glycyl-radical enzyme activating protein [Qingrenia yutianensis]MBC8595701.1 glycyl-radical enzyme activating protein [Qingrenia yutianensis]
MIKGLIADIQRASIHDGDGVRTTVFFKGCPLSCKWCHNPECISFEKEILYYPEKCIHCGMCDKGCFSGARVVCGKSMTADEVLSEIMLDVPYYGDTGGVTFSGGEPFAQGKFLNACIDKCKENGINCAVETSLMYFDEEIFKKLDFVMADLKIWNSDLHKKYTGAGNEKIIENFENLNKLNIPIIARTPVIPEINQGIDKISAFLKTLSNVRKYELLPYHPLGNSKRKALGQKADGFSVPSKEYMKELEKYAYVR